MPSDAAGYTEDLAVVLPDGAAESPTVQRRVQRECEVVRGWERRCKCVVWLRAWELKISADGRRVHTEGSGDAA